MGIEKASAHAVSARDEKPLVRLTGILIEDDEILLVQESLRERTNWNVPGGKLEFGESIREGLRREMREETGLDVEVGDLLYVCDRFRSLGDQVVDMSFIVRRRAGALISGRVVDAEGETLKAVRMVPISLLTSYGLSERFAELAAAGFPGRGSYQGDFHEFYDGAGVRGMRTA